MDSNTLLEIGNNILNFIVNNWQLISLIPLVIYYIKNKMWDKLFELAVKESIKFNELRKDELDNNSKQKNVEAVLEENVLSNFFNSEDITNIVKSAYHTKVKK